MAELVGFELDPGRGSSSRTPSGSVRTEVGIEGGCGQRPAPERKGRDPRGVELTAVFTWLPEMGKSNLLLIHSARVHHLAEALRPRVVAGREHPCTAQPGAEPATDPLAWARGIQDDGRLPDRVSLAEQISRADSCDMLIFDEAMFLPESVMGAVADLEGEAQPAVWYAGSAVDQEVQHEGLVFTRVRDRARRREGAHLLRVVARLRAPRRRSRGGLPRRGLVLEVQPAYGIRIFRDHFESEVRALDRRTVAVELGGATTPTPRARRSTRFRPSSGRLASSETRCSSIPCASPSTPSVVPRSPPPAGTRTATGTSRCSRSSPARTGSRASSPTWRPGTPRLRIVCDGAGPAASIVPAIEEAGITVATIDAANHAAACGRLVDVVSEGSFGTGVRSTSGTQSGERRPGRSATAGHGAASHRTWTSRRSSPPRWHWRRRWRHVRAYGRHRDLRDRRSYGRAQVPDIAGSGRVRATRADVARADCSATSVSPTSSRSRCPSSGPTSPRSAATPPRP